MRIVPTPETIQGDAFVGVSGVVKAETPKAILILRQGNEHWLPKSQIIINGTPVKGSVILVDVPLWLAKKQNLPVSYSPSTAQARQENEQNKYVLPLPALKAGDQEMGELRLGETEEQMRQFFSVI